MKTFSSFRRGHQYSLFDSGALLGALKCHDGKYKAGSLNICTIMASSDFFFFFWGGRESNHIT